MPFQNSSIFNFKRFLVAIMLPVIITIALAGCIFSYFFEKKIILNNEITGAYKINRIINETHPDEIPIFGSSRAEGCFIPDSLTGNCFNYGLSGANYDVTLFMLNEECKKTKSTPWVILNFDMEGLTYGLGDISNYIPNSDNAGVRNLLGKEYKPYFRIPFIKYYGRFENYLRLYLSDKIKLTKFTDKGASVDKNVLPLKKFNELVKMRGNTMATFYNDPSLQAKLKTIITTHSNRRFLFVIPPYHPSYFEKYTNISETNAFFNELQSHQNVKVLDYSRLTLPDSMFVNTSHINLIGTVLFNHMLADTLRTIGVH